MFSILKSQLVIDTMTDQYAHLLIKEGIVVEGLGNDIRVEVPVGLEALTDALVDPAFSSMEPAAAHDKTRPGPPDIVVGPTFIAASVPETVENGYGPHFGSRFFLAPGRVLSLLRYPA